LAGINQKYARQFLNALIADKRILVQKIPREERRRALSGTCERASPGHQASRQAAEETFLKVMIADGLTNAPIIDFRRMLESGILVPLYGTHWRD